MADLDSVSPVLSQNAGAPISAPGKVGKFDRLPEPRDWRFWIGGLGRTLIATGLLMFGFVAYQLWGTGIETARAQNSLESEFTELLGTSPPAAGPDEATSGSVAPGLEESTDPESAAGSEATVEPVPVDEQVIPFVEEGDAIARLEIPAIGVDKIVVAGVETSDLKKGPGHYPETPLPGQLGNAAIAGHRTTYGQPFYDVDKLEPGDEIIATTPNGRFVYLVTGQQIVSPNQYEVVATTDPTVASLTLTSCHPRYTARERIVITSELDQSQSATVGEPVVNYGRPLGAADDGATVTEPASADDAPTVTNAISDAGGLEADEVGPASASGASASAVDAGIADAFAEGWFSDPSANVQVAMWGVLLALIGVGSFLLSRTTRRDWVGGLVGLLPFIVALYFFFQNVNRLLPPNL